MRKIIVGSGLIVSGIAQTAESMASVIGSVPTATVMPTGKWQSKTDACARIAQLKAKFCPRKVRIGDFFDDFSVLQRDMLVLGEDMKKAERKLTRDRRSVEEPPGAIR